MTQTRGESNTETLYCKQVGDFYRVRKFKLPQECFCLVLLKLAVTAGVL